MAVFRFSRRAEDDLLRIGEYTVRAWGEAQADRYLSELEARCQLLAENPELGRPCNKVRSGLRRMEHGELFVFYRQKPGGVFVVRLLHQSMLPERQTFDDRADDIPSA